jgi:hypothetical protein
LTDNKEGFEVSCVGLGRSADRVALIVQVRATWLPDHATAVEVTVSKRKDLFGEGPWLPAEVNWGAYGSVDPVEAEAMALALTMATIQARKLDAELGGGE